MKAKNQFGFTLIEIMIVLAILAILAAMAIPRYQSFSAMAKRSEGFAFLSGVNLFEISYFTDYDTYALDPVKIFLSGALNKFPKYYQGGIIGSNVINPIILVSSNPKSGYLGIIAGNLDADPSLDILALIIGAPQSFPNGFNPPVIFSDGIHVLADDRIN